jgi:hypothetical protein
MSQADDIFAEMPLPGDLWELRPPTTATLLVKQVYADPGVDVCVQGTLIGHGPTFVTAPIPLWLFRKTWRLVRRGTT